MHSLVSLEPTRGMRRVSRLKNNRLLSRVSGFQANDISSYGVTPAGKYACFTDDDMGS